MRPHSLLLCLLPDEIYSLLRRAWLTFSPRTVWARWKDECPSDRTLSITIPFRRLVDCSQPDSLEHIQKTNFSNFQKGKTMRDRLSILGNGIFAVDGDTWHQQRKVTSKVFTPTLFRTAISASVHSNLARFASILEKHADREECAFASPPFPQVGH